MRFLFKKQRGMNAVLKMWEELNRVQQLFVLEGVQLDPDEVPIIGCADDTMRMVITTRRLIWRSAATVHGLDLDNIAAVNVPGFFESSKHDVHELRLVARDGAEFQLDTALGEPLFILWNFLLGIRRPANVGGSGTDDGK